MFGSNDDKKTPAALARRKACSDGCAKSRRNPSSNSHSQFLSQRQRQSLRPLCCQSPSQCCNRLPRLLTKPRPNCHRPRSLSWLTLPVAEEPVALVEDEQAPQVTPPIPVHARGKSRFGRQCRAGGCRAGCQSARACTCRRAGRASPCRRNQAGFFARLKQGLSKTSASIGEGMASLFLGKKVIDDDLLDEIETRC
jgi:fused signal recognition particle receptor